MNASFSPRPTVRPSCVMLHALHQRLSCLSCLCNNYYFHTCLNPQNISNAWNTQQLHTIKRKSNTRHCMPSHIHGFISEMQAASAHGRIVSKKRTQSVVASTCRVACNARKNELHHTINHTREVRAEAIQQRARIA
jgi:hypothetical protein